MPASQYTRERLSEAAASSQTLSEALVKLGVDPKSRTRGYLRERMRKMEVDTRHFEREGPLDKRHPQARGESAASVPQLSLGDRHVSRACQGTPLGSGQPMSDRQQYTRERLVQAADRCTDIGEVIAFFGTRPLQPTRPTSDPQVRPLRHRHLPLPARRLRLEVDHINGDRGDDRVENLRFLCPNCHAVTDTWCRGGARRTA
ncbi:HNH endonuclease signature motif containing protein [Streptomyces laculatispora]|uniref:HNH endonuclease signature motif containing protein n=1 Tax=Streptomyces laculatispora TaxID=887464 RepID=A0ABY9I7W3_9ACTN|nr:HNH endonuclease signature motif containing protein [Streptomyces laculatispora]WLQ42865.1 HNH endonuclease signature motif containing protein [Streptomyces laculatispora]